ncbi:hypothetical protein LCM20_06460 [Halobacillus litoralis]|uniref:hypothetical protein n=1 Tax=Halobacillus litoralis TaxID=45668 RepID=UPI001CD2EBEB|nr:hypothetical protein [Halobacillus litoralis]MCA0970223.1 hypothetical protein [Halobacillus litoralis]
MEEEIDYDLRQVYIKKKRMVEAALIGFLFIGTLYQTIDGSFEMPVLAAVLFLFLSWLHYGWKSRQETAELWKIWDVKWSERKYKYAVLRSLPNVLFICLVAAPFHPVMSTILAFILFPFFISRNLEKWHRRQAMHEHNRAEVEYGR